MDEVACLCTAGRRAAAALTRLYDDALAPHGLRATQFSLLRAVERAGGGSFADLATRTGLDRSTLGRNLRVLARDEWVHIAGDEQDARAAHVHLTPRGREALGEAVASWQRAQRRVRSALGADADTFKRIADLLADL